MLSAILEDTQRLEDDWNAIMSFPQRNSEKLRKSLLAHAASETVQADGYSSF